MKLTDKFAVCALELSLFLLFISPLINLISITLQRISNALMIFLIIDYFK